MDTEKNLLDLFGEVNFKVMKREASVEEFKEIARHKEEQYARIEAMGVQHVERIKDMMALALAEKLHPPTAYVEQQAGESLDERRG
jgi:hypothetical protein